MLYLVKSERWGEKIEEELLAVQMITDSRIIFTSDASFADFEQIFFQNAHHGNHIKIKPNSIFKLEKAATSLR